MDRRSLLAIAVGLIIVLVAVMVALTLRNKKLKESGNVRNRKKTLAFTGKFALFCSRFTLTRKTYNKVRAQIAILNPSDEYTLEKLAGGILLKSYAMSLAALLAVFILVLISGFDLFYILSGFLAALVIMKASTNGKLRSLREKLLEQERDAFTAIRHFYHQEGRVDSAINRCIIDAGPIIRPHLEEIYEIISSVKTTEKMEEYIAKAPDENLSVFVSTCAAIKEYGDKKMEDGESMFLKNIGFLKEEVDAEIILQRKKSAAFKGVLGMTLAPLLGIKPLEIWATGNMPTISQYYTGIYSTVSIMGTFILTYLIYTIIDMMMETSQNKTKSESVFAKIASVPAISGILSGIINRSYNKWQKVDSMLRGMGDHTGIKAFILKRLVYGIAGFLMTFVVFIAGTAMSRTSLMQNFKADYENNIQVTDEYKITMEEMSADLIEKHLKDEVTEEDLKAQIAEEYEVSESVAGQVAVAVLNHKVEIAGTIFMWWHLLLAFMAGFLAQYIPMLILKLNKGLITSRQQEEVMQFQTLMLILMHIPGVSLTTVLEWMERSSSCFLESITACRANLGHGQSKAIEEMKYSETFEPFRSFCDNLLAIDRVGMADAFDEIESDHTFYMESKKQQRDEDIKKKAERAGMLSMIPMYTVLALYLLIPMIRYALEMFGMFTDTVNL